MRLVLSAWSLLALPLPALVLADPGEAPRSLDVASGARPIGSAAPEASPAGGRTTAAAAGSSTGWISRDSGLTAAAPPNRSAAAALRWRSPAGQPAEATCGSNACRPALVWRDKRGAEEATGIIAASYQQADAPFEDPFGDRRGTSGPVRQAAAELELTPAATNAHDGRWSGGAVEPALMLAPAAPGGAGQAERGGFDSDDPAPPPPLGDIGNSARQDTPQAPGGSDERRRIYGDPGRDCFADGEACRSALQTLRESTIKKISVDITAPFTPDAESPEEEFQARTDRIRQMPPRTWRNRAGGVLADGKLVEIAFRKILVEDRGGRTREIPLVELSDDDLCFLAAWWKVPTECTLGDEMYAGRSWQPMTMTWKASAVCHKPLYFEEVQLERYGHTTGPLFQPVVSGAHFFLNIAALPYQMGIHPVNECRYALGYYRPGSCAPWLLPPVPISVRGGLAQAGAVVGLVALFP